MELNGIEPGGGDAARDHELGRAGNLGRMWAGTKVDGARAVDRTIATPASLAVRTVVMRIEEQHAAGFDETQGRRVPWTDEDVFYQGGTSRRTIATPEFSTVRPVGG